MKICYLLFNSLMNEELKSTLAIQSLMLCVNKINICSSLLSDDDRGDAHTHAVTKILKKKKKGKSKQTCCASSVMTFRH